MNNITEATQEKILGFARGAVTKVLRTLGKDIAGGTGGYLRLFLEIDTSKGPFGWHQLTCIRFGRETDEAAWERSQFISMEKFLRLAKRHAFFHRELSSWQSRNPDRWEWGGAFIVVANIPEFGGMVKILVSSSGFSEFVDETLGLIIFEKLGWLGTGNFEMITAISGNDVASQFLRYH